MSIVATIEREFIKATRKGWDKIYVAVDLHETMIEPNWNASIHEHEYYPGAKELLVELTNHPDIVMFLWTCSHHGEIVQYLKKFEKDGIKFKYVNENPDVLTDYSGDNNYGCYVQKPYWNILFEDKAGWDPAEIPLVRETFKRMKLPYTV